jgi:hypothetical protein
MKRTLGISLNIVLLALFGAGSVLADTVVVVTPSSPTWVSGTTNNGGVAQINGNQPRSGNGSLQGSTANPSSHAQYQTSGAFGNLSSLTHVGFEWYRDGAGSAGSAGILAPSYQFSGFANGSSGFYTLTWEWYLNNPGNAPVDTWVTEDMTQQQFWLRIGAVNGAELKTLAQWALDPRLAGANIFTFTVNDGSNWGPGPFNGYVDNYIYEFGQGNRVTTNFEAAETPEPVSVLLFGTGLTALGAKLRRKRNNKQSV